MNSYKVISLLSNQERVITGRPWLIITHLNQTSTNFYGFYKNVLSKKFNIII